MKILYKLGYNLVFFTHDPRKESQILKDNIVPSLNIKGQPFIIIYFNTVGTDHFELISYKDKMVNSFEDLRDIHMNAAAGLSEENLIPSDETRETLSTLLASALKSSESPKSSPSIKKPTQGVQGASSSASAYSPTIGPKESPITASSNEDPLKDLKDAFSKIKLRCTVPCKHQIEIIMAKIKLIIDSGKPDNIIKNLNEFYDLLTDNIEIEYDDMIMSKAALEGILKKIYQEFFKKGEKSLLPIKIPTQGVQGASNSASAYSPTIGPKESPITASSNEDPLKDLKDAFSKIKLRCTVPCKHQIEIIMAKIKLIIDSGKPDNIIKNLNEFYDLLTDNIEIEYDDMIMSKAALEGILKKIYQDFLKKGGNSFYKKYLKYKAKYIKFKFLKM